MAAVKIYPHFMATNFNVQHSCAPDEMYFEAVYLSFSLDTVSTNGCVLR